MLAPLLKSWLEQLPGGMCPQTLFCGITITMPWKSTTRITMKKSRHDNKPFLTEVSVHMQIQPQRTRPSKAQAFNQSCLAHAPTIQMTSWQESGEMKHHQTQPYQNIKHIKTFFISAYHLKVMFRMFLLCGIASNHKPVKSESHCWIQNKRCTVDRLLSMCSTVATHVIHSGSLK